MDFSKRFSRGRGKSGEICFLTCETKKTAFFAEIFKFLPLSDTHACVEENVCATPLKIGVISSVSTPF